MTRPAAGTPAMTRLANRDSETRVLAWGALPPPVHGSAVVNDMVREVIDRVGDGHWVNAATGDLSEIGRVKVRKLWATLGRLADYVVQAVRWAPGYTAYVSIAISGPTGVPAAALYRDLLIWTIAALTSRRIVIHVQAADLSGLRPRGPLAPLWRWLLRRSEFWVLGSVLVAPLRELGAVDIHVLQNGVTCESRYHGEGRQGAHAARQAARAAAPEAARHAARAAAPEAALADSGEPSSSTDGADVRVVFLSHHFRFKGVDVVAELADMLEDEPFAWAFAGSAVDPDIEALLKPLERLGGRYRRIEAVDADVRCRLLHRSDVFVLPSRNEGVPLVLLEAMEHGVIPIVSPRGCMPEVVDDVGAVCETLEDYAEALRLLATDRGELAKRSEDTLVRWRERYSRAAFERRVAELLSGAAGAEAREDGARA